MCRCLGEAGMSCITTTAIAAYVVEARSCHRCFEEESSNEHCYSILSTSVAIRIDSIHLISKHTYHAIRMLQGCCALEKHCNSDQSDRMYLV